MAADIEFFLYSRKSCRPCHDFRIRLDSLLAGQDYRCHVIDVDSDGELIRRYGARVPVLVSGGLEICESRFDADAILDFIRRRFD